MQQYENVNDKNNFIVHIMQQVHITSTIKCWINCLLLSSNFLLVFIFFWAIYGHRSKLSFGDISLSLNLAQKEFMATFTCLHFSLSIYVKLVISDQHGLSLHKMGLHHATGQ